MSNIWFLPADLTKHFFLLKTKTVEKKLKIPLKNSSNFSFFLIQA